MVDLTVLHDGLDWLLLDRIEKAVWGVYRVKKGAMVACRRARRALSDA